MDFRTQIDIPQSTFKISYSDNILFLGSCFTENIGTKMADMRFRVNVNPFGVLYNPLSVASSCLQLKYPQIFEKSDLVFYNGLYHSFSHHSRFSNASAETCIANINKSLSAASKQFSELTYLILTFGTSYVYRLKESGEIVANCHKLPEKTFLRERLNVDLIIREWSQLLEDIWMKNPSLKVIMTVSPIRHWRDGAHINQVSKSILLLAEQTLAEKYPERTAYFPAYEIMMDELRDYRFYADDMVHPSQIAIDYIWEKFKDTFFDKETNELCKEVGLINKSLKHKPFNRDSVAYKQFLIQTMQKIKSLKEKNPYICFPEEERNIAYMLQTEK